MSNVVNWFEIPVSNMERAKKFYSAVFSKEMMDMPSPDDSEMAAFPWEEGGANSAGCLIKGEGYEPSAAGTVVYFTCDDVSNELGRVESNGGKALTPKIDIGEFGFIAQFMDTECNRVALHSRS